MASLNILCADPHNFLKKLLKKKKKKKKKKEGKKHIKIFL